MLHDDRDIIFSALIKIGFNCEKHPQEIANMIIKNQQTQARSIICSSCLALTPSQSKEVKPFKIALLQIHHSCKRLLTDVTISAFVDHHLNLVRGIIKNHFKQIEGLLHALITNWFLKYRDLIVGKYFNEFYAAGSQILDNYKQKNSYEEGSAMKAKRIKRLMNFIDSFYKLVTSFEDQQKMRLDSIMSGQNLVKQIKTEVGDMYKQFKQRAQTSKNWQQDQIIQLFNPSLQTSHNYRFSNSMHHIDVKIVDLKTAKMPNLPDNQYTLLALIEPCIGSKKRSIKLKMAGVKGWVAAGIAFRSKVQANAYKFQTSNHGTFQISYDGYSWSEDSSINEQYTSWYFNQNDTLTMTVTPSSGELVFAKNEDHNNVYTLKFKNEKKDKLYFCVSLNYQQDCVVIAQ